MITRYRSALSSLMLVAVLSLVSACASDSETSDPDADFAALQERGEVGMGVDQYASTHRFDDIADGGRIEFVHDGQDEEAVETIRAHLQEIRTAFGEGDFSIPAFVHDQVVPGTDRMAERKDRIEFRYRDLPGGGELRMVTSDPEALEAIHEFMAFQRDDHRSGGMDHGTMDHGTMDHGGMSHRMMQGATGDPSFAADMQIIHELLTHHSAITRTVDHLPNGIRTLTESTSPAIAGLIISHVRSMEQRLEEGEVFNLFSHTIPEIFENYDRIQSEFEYTYTGVAVVQTSEDPQIVAALQGHAAEVTEMVDEGMIAMMRGMMQSRMGGGSR
ncbi:MAG: hypothetical protein EA351_01000 [Gemmatimonadales bacterium]|nr:MAG: hypothetical protein EA351_01000 [Gemmatimonadales bacterium]